MLTALSVIGELLVTAGVVALLYFAYSFFWTNVQAQASANDAVQQLQQEWKRGSSAAPDPRRVPPPAGASVGTESPAAAAAGAASKASEQGVGNDAGAAQEKLPASSQAFALLRIPRLGRDWLSPVVEGVARGPFDLAPEELGRGVVHYPKTALPGGRGNFAVAGHRATHGEPFRDLDQVRTGDEISVETRARTYTYRVTGTAIVSPTSTDVLSPVPGRPGAKPDAARLTLTTCHPRWASTWRLIVSAELVSAGAR